VALEIARNAAEADFCFVPRKVLFYFFQIAEIGLFVRQLQKQQIESWAQHPT
jgi:hypothetical protein